MEHLSDAELLGRYLSVQDEAAFAAIVRRHGPMVRGVCRRLLHDSHEADDAFQATFLVLVRRAGAIKPHNLLGNWLYGVARRTWMWGVRQRRDAIAWIRASGGAVTYEHQFDTAAPVGAAAKPPGTGWLRRLLGDEAASEVRSVTLRGASIANADLERLRFVAELNHLEIAATRVTAHGLRSLRRLKQLRSLWLSGLAADDDGLAEISQLSNLEMLSFDGHGGNLITDRGLSSLSKLSKLSRVDLGEADVTDAGLAGLRQALPRCRIWVSRNRTVIAVP